LIVNGQPIVLFESSTTKPNGIYVHTTPLEIKSHINWS